MKRTCINCAYWCQYSRCGSGECRRHAPGPMYSMTGDKPGPIWWPQTLAEFWCGDYETRVGSVVRSGEEIESDDYVASWNRALAATKNSENFSKNLPKKFQKKSKKKTEYEHKLNE